MNYFRNSLDFLSYSDRYSGLLELIDRKQEKINLLIADSPLAYLISGINRDSGRSVLIVTSTPDKARKMYEELLFWGNDNDRIRLFPEAENIQFERITSEESIAHERIVTLDKAISTDLPNLRPIIVTSIQGICQSTLSVANFLSSRSHVSVGQSTRLDELLAYWLQIGYTLDPVTEIPGRMSRRGGILDIFPPGYENPVRIEFFGDTIESIRFFDPYHQTSIGTTNSVVVLPPREYLPSLIDENVYSDMSKALDFSNCTNEVSEGIRHEIAGLSEGGDIAGMILYQGFMCSSSLLDFIDKDTIIILDRESELDQEAIKANDRISSVRASKETRGEIPRHLPLAYQEWDSVRDEIHARFLVFGTSPIIRDINSGTGLLDMGFETTNHYMGNLPELAKDIDLSIRDNNHFVIVSNHARRLSGVLGYEYSQDEPSSLVNVNDGRTQLSVLRGSLGEGWSFSFKGGYLRLLTDLEIFGHKKKTLRRRRSRLKNIPIVSELEIGRFLVHIEHGIGKFIGTTHMYSGENQSEFLVLEYADRDKLYVPTAQLDRISNYSSTSDRQPKLSRLGTQEWNRTKNRAKEATEELAKELLSLYAARETFGGIAYSEDTPWQTQMEDSFQYQETADQILSISDVKRDMELKKPMDRLICGDVGYGKTEVALRAAFKAVMDGFQVALLVPTTLLAQQHYATFVERLASFPIKIDVLSRFRSEDEQRKLVSGMKDGSVDICIGTHRLLQADIGFKNLGLIIVDEEQRFGVKQKERLKIIRNDVDVLSLSATPIPRTLHMALSGIRDMSTIETPPEDRLSIKTYICEYSDTIIKEAILKELDRGGQVFFLHNRVRSIERVSEHIRNLVPGVAVGTGHGRMPEDELDNVMVGFSRKEFDVLVCTTIIESGLDIPNANTLIVDRADTMGLAQLYQLRGRIGRSADRAYAYFMVPRDKLITESAQKRINTIAAATELGSGFRIAMRELEIRGAGSLLGKEQSGHIHAVGYDLYSQLLSQAVEELRDEDIESGDRARVRYRDIHVDLPIDAYIPTGYVSDLQTRLSIYQRMSHNSSIDSIYSLSAEMEDRFGSVPDVVNNLIYILMLKHKAKDALVGSVIVENGEIVVKLIVDIGGARLALQRYIGDLAVVGNIHLRMPLANKWRDRLLALLDLIKNFHLDLVSA